ncbi:aspartate kinase [Rubrobacter aplysinae]|uniref:aspartate kinase n=1 Tax=Rubrobacter aplysinae TaxID=909625 RepID=UPI00069D841B|nr:aspartate kinase [Rubrobacter aplysinae]
MSQRSREPSLEPLVIKFGGTSVGGGAEFVRAARMVADEALGRPVVVVVSAMSGTTDTLLGYAGTTAGGDDRTSTGATREGSLAELHRTLAERHLSAARHAVSEEHLPPVEERIYELLGGLLEAIASGGETPEARRARRAEIAVYGERLSACILAGAIASAGAPAAVAGDPIATDAAHAEAEVDSGRTRERAAGNVVPLLEAGEVAVVPGFVGRSPEGGQTTLGRGGSDLSATALGAALGSREVWICSDVDGVLDADPALVGGARLVPRLSYREASSMAGLGAKVLHPKTMEPARAAGIEVTVRSTFNRNCAGTCVCSREPGSGIRGVVLRRGVSLVRESGVPETPVFRMLGSSGYGVDYLLHAGDGEREPAGHAAVVCVGSPGCDELSAGISVLGKRGITVCWAGLCSDGLLFVVDGDDARSALETLHGSLLGIRSGDGETADEGSYSVEGVA